MFTLLHVWMENMRMHTEKKDTPVQQNVNKCTMKKCKSKIVFFKFRFSKEAR